MYETYLRQLFRLRTEYWQTPNTALRNLKLSRMVLFANACGVDLIEFLSEESPDKSTLKAESEPKATVKAETKAKAAVLLQNPCEKATVNAKKAKAYRCPNCDFTTDSPKALSGHMKNTVPNISSLNPKRNQRGVAASPTPHAVRQLVRPPHRSRTGTLPLNTTPNAPPIFQRQRACFASRTTCFQKIGRED